MLDGDPSPYNDHGSPQSGNIRLRKPICCWRCRARLSRGHFAAEVDAGGGEMQCDLGSGPGRLVISSEARGKLRF